MAAVLPRYPQCIAELKRFASVPTMHCESKKRFRLGKMRAGLPRYPQCTAMKTLERNGALSGPYWFYWCLYWGRFTRTGPNWSALIPFLVSLVPLLGSVFRTGLNWSLLVPHWAQVYWGVASLPPRYPQSLAKHFCLVTHSP